MDEIMHRNKLGYWLFLLPLVAAVSYFLLSLWLLQTGHLHEDAYILFEYVRHFVAGDGIVYFTGGERAEGATDFLWFMLLSLLAYLRLDLGIAAAILNAIGMFCILAICLRVMPFTSLRRGLFFYCLFAVLVIVSPLAAASIGGFSTLFYVAVSMLLVALYWQDDKARLVYIPLVAILLALIRPDGVIIGVLFCLLGLIEVLHTAYLRKYLVAGVFAAIIGVIYFAWRYHYFGQLLPLPLYVKAYHASLDSGWPENLNWLAKSKIMILVVAVFVFTSPCRVKVLKLLIPFCGLLISLAMTHQSQNIDFRFQGPIWGCLLFLLALAIYQMVEKAGLKRGIFWASLILLVIIQPYSKRFEKVVSALQSTDYINYLPMELSNIVNENTKIALTEAGRMAFWNNAQTYDLVGLNTVYTAKNRVDPAYLQSLMPDMIFIHTAGTLENFAENGNYFRTDIAEISSHIKPDYVTGWKGAEDPVIRSPLTVFAFLQENHEYEIFLVRYGKEYWHMYAIRQNGSVLVEDFLLALEKSFTMGARKSYMQAVKSEY